MGLFSATLVKKAFKAFRLVARTLAKYPCQDYGFLTDFSLLFCLIRFTFVNFSHPYDTNLFSYLPFMLSYAFTLTDHTMKKE